MRLIAGAAILVIGALLLSGKARAQSVPVRSGVIAGIAPASRPSDGFPAKGVRRYVVIVRLATGEEVSLVQTEDQISMVAIGQKVEIEGVGPKAALRIPDQPSRRSLL